MVVSPPDDESPSNRASVLESWVWGLWKALEATSPSLWPEELLLKQET